MSFRLLYLYKYTVFGVVCSYYASHFISEDSKNYYTHICSWHKCVYT